MWISKQEFDELRRIKQDVKFEQEKKLILAKIHQWKITMKDRREFMVKGYLLQSCPTTFYDEHGVVAEFAFNEVLAIERVDL